MSGEPNAIRWRHDELAHDLAVHLTNGARMVWEDMQLGPVGSPRPDVYVIEKSYSRFAPVAYEVKISRSDYLADVTAGKWQSYLAYACSVVFATPAGLITPSELPPGTGLILRHGEVWRTARRPVPQAVANLPRDAWLKLLLDGVERTELRRLADHRQTVSSWYTVGQAVEKRYGRDLAELIGTAVRDRNRLEHAHLEAEKRLATIHAETHQRVAEVRAAVAAELLPELQELAKAVGVKAPSVDRYTVMALTQALERARTELAADRLVAAAREDLRYAANTLEQLRRRCETTAARMEAPANASA